MRGEEWGMMARKHEFSFCSDGNIPNDMGQGAEVTA